MRILLAAFGTRGDVQPMVALGSRMRDDGHHVTIGASPGFEAWVRGRALDFHAIGLDIEAWTRTHPDLVHRPARAFGPVVRYLREDLERSMGQTMDAARGTDLIVSGVHSAAPSVAEALGVPHRTILLCPQMIPTRHLPPPGIPWFGLHPELNRSLWSLFAHGMNAMLRDRLNSYRRAFHLAPVPSVLDYLCPSDAILASDARMGDLPADAPRSIVQTGALPDQDGAALDPELERFLANGDPPVYVGFGSMPDADAARTTRAIVDCVSAMRRRAVLLSGWAGLGAVDLPDEVLLVRSVPHALLFPRVALAVHHGGAGTTAAVARAGVPQIVVPHIADQFYWGHQVFERGIGSRPIPRGALTSHLLSEAIRTIESRPGIIERARSVAAGISATDGMTSMLRLLYASAARPLLSRAAA